LCPSPRRLWPWPRQQGKSATLRIIKCFTLAWQKTKEYAQFNNFSFFPAAAGNGALLAANKGAAMSSALIPNPLPGDANNPSPWLSALLAETPKGVDVRKRGFDPFVKGVWLGAIVAIIGLILGMYLFKLIF
jgi:hypothetical protein